jgi:PadR family transcriptional regulator AphA
MTFDQILLGLVLLSPRTGYELKKWLDVEGVFIRANSDQAQIYRTLRRLMRAGLADFREERRSGPPAKVYFATDAGSDHLQGILREPWEPPARWQEADFNARMLFMILLHPDGVLPMLQVERDYRVAQRLYFRSFPRAYDVDRGVADPDLAGQLFDDLEHYGRAVTDAWIAELDRRIAAWAPLLGNPADEG